MVRAGSNDQHPEQPAVEQMEIGKGQGSEIDPEQQQLENEQAEDECAALNNILKQQCFQTLVASVEDGVHSDQIGDKVKCSDLKERANQ